MSYATSLQMAYPPPYGPSTLLSDDLVHRSSVLPYYTPSALPYRTGNHLLSDDFLYNPIGLAPLTYRTTTYPHFSAITDWQRDVPARTSYAPINNVREYSASLGTPSVANTASTVARSIQENNSKNKFPNYQPSYTRLPSDADRQAPLTTIWSSRRPRQSTQEEESTVTYRSMPELSAAKRQSRSPVEERKRDPTPPPPPVLTKQESKITTTTEPEKALEEPSTVDDHAWVTESRKASPVDEQSWANKIEQLHTVQAQREKEKAKAARMLPNLPTKKVVQKPAVGSDKKGRISPYQRRTSTYFDSLFDGNYYRKTPRNQPTTDSSFSSQNKSNTTSPNKPKATISPKQPPPPPPLTNRAPPLTTTTWKKQGQNQNSNDSLTPRENLPKDTDERFREALQKFRADRAEQQQRELAESTAKRIDYGNYVRRSTRDHSLRNVVKPSPWADFMDTKKGNVYSLVKEEKKDLYNQSKSYGERVRCRNFALHNGAETARVSYRANEESKFDQEPDNTDEDESNSTVKFSSKKPAINNNTETDRTTKPSNQSSSSNRTSENDPDESDFHSQRKDKKKAYHSSVTATSATEESDADQTTEQRNTEDDDDLSTVRGGNKLESSEGGVRSKKH